MPVVRKLTPAEAIRRAQRELAERKRRAEAVSVSASAIEEAKRDMPALDKRRQARKRPAALRSAGTIVSPEINIQALDEGARGDAEEIGLKSSSESDLGRGSSLEEIAPACAVPQSAQDRKPTQNACPTSAESERSRRLKVAISARKPQPVSVAPSGRKVDAGEQLNRADPAIEPVASSDFLQNPITASESQHEPGHWRLADMRQGQCRFACTPHDVRPEDHRFCGARTRIQAGNLHGTWCDEHLAVVWSEGSSWNARRKRA